MKIGIITWFKYENYGTALQALALQKYLRTNGFDVDLINYTIEEKKKKKNLKHLFPRIILKLNKIRYKNLFLSKTEKFKSIIYDNCNVTKEVTNVEEYIKLCNSYDIVIFGSDQIWNPDVYHPFYFANFDEIKCKLVAYAPSFGMNHIPEDKIEELKKALSRFSSIAVREEDGCKIIKQLIDIDVDTVVDPTLLLEKNKWKEFEEPIDICKDDYVLCYFLSDNLCHWKAARTFAKKKNLKLVVIPHDGLSYIQSKYVVRSCTVGNFLSLIKNAKYVLTDSFHGSVFSLIYEKQFVLFERHSNKNSSSQNSRLYNLLRMVGLNEILLKNGTKEIEDVDNIDYSLVRKKINCITKKSEDYLKQVIK